MQNLEMENQKQNQNNTEEHNLIVLMHALTLLAILFFFLILGPILIWFLKKDEYPLLHQKGIDLFNFLLSFALYQLVLGALTLTIIGAIVSIPCLIILAVMGFITQLIALIRAINDRNHEYPLTIRFLK